MTSKEFMHVATAVDGEWLAELGENEVENIFFFYHDFQDQCSIQSRSHQRREKKPQ